MVITRPTALCSKKFPHFGLMKFQLFLREMLQSKEPNTSSFILTLK